MNLKKNGKVFTSKFVGIGPSSSEKRIYLAAVSQRLRNTAIHAERNNIYNVILYEPTDMIQYTETWNST